MIPFDLCDMHGHFLPGMDDGSKTVEMSLAMLKMSREQGVNRMFATPHYYPVESAAEFLARRDRAEQTLRQAMEAAQEPFPQFLVGAEVAYRPGIGYAQDLEKLCLGNSHYLLLELPFSPWSREVIRDVRNMTSTRGVIPILAHIERYLSAQKPEVVRAVLEQDVLVQMNAEYLLDWRTRGKGKKLLKTQTAHLLGTDCHRLEQRAPNLEKAAAYLEKCGMADQLRQISQLSNQIFEEAI